MRKRIAACALLLAAAAAFWALTRKRDAAPPCGNCLECRTLERRLREEGRIGEAVAALKAAGRLRLCGPEVDAELANIYIAMGRYEAARRSFAHFRKQGGDPLRSYIQEGYAGMIAGRDSEALAAFKKAIARAPSNPEGYLHMGAYWAGHGPSEKAEKYFRMALDRSAHDDLSGKSCAPGAPVSDRPHIVSQLASVLIASRRFVEAESLLRRELYKIAPRCYADFRSHFLAMIGDIDCSRGSLRTAEGYYRKAVEACEHISNCQRSAQEISLLSFAKCEANHGRLALARRLASRAESLALPAKDRTSSPDPTAGLSSLAALYLAIGDLAGAERMFERVVSYYGDMPRSPNLARAMTELANVRRRQGRLKESESLLVRALAIDEANDSVNEAEQVRRSLESVRKALGG